MDTHEQSGAELAQNPAEGPQDDVAAVRAMMADSVPLPPIMQASVRVMRSHDYCHFEVVLHCAGEAIVDCREYGSFAALHSMQPVGAVIERAALSIEQVDAARKAAARLVDKAIEQFKTAKRAALIRMNRKGERAQMYREAENIEATVPEDQRTPEQKALLKTVADDAYWASRGDYDYQDDWRDDEED